MIKKIHKALGRNTLSKALGHKKMLAVAIPLLMAVQAQGLEFYVGGIEGSFDSQLSLGSSWRVEAQDDKLASDAAGGNNEDGNRNFKKGDAFSQVFKGSHDLQFSYQNFGGFVRGKYWYDSALANNNVEIGHGPTAMVAGGPAGSALTYDNNSRLDDSEFNDLAKFSGVALLDAFVYGEFEVADMPLDVRLGKQVVSWGESTFIFGGINAINPVDVSSFRRPGAEIKEGLIPVNMAYANIGLTDTLSAEAFYQLEFQETVIPGCGTYFAGNDYAPEGCDTVSLAGGGVSLTRDEDGNRKAKSDGQFGFAVRYVAESLADTEFGFYAMNIHSRTPVASGIKAQNWVNGLALVPGLVGSNMAGGMDQATATQTAIAQAQGQSLVPNSVSTSYFISYPEDMQLAGLSFATNVGTMAVSGEISHKMDVPLQINATQLLGAALTGMSTAPQLVADVQAVADGGVVQGYRLFDVTQAQMTGIKFFDQVAGANRIALIAEAGYTFVHGLDESDDAIKFSRSGIYDGEEAGFVTESSWGYRARIVADYSDVFAGVNLKPVLAWSHDVEGFAPQPGGAFREGQQSLGLTLKADYLATYNASIAYTQYMGGDYSVISDRDFASISIGMQF